ncbi:hypothetical protein IGJ00_002479 [Enterococcus sp. AZ062]
MRSRKQTYVNLWRYWVKSDNIFVEINLSLLGAFLLA